MRGLVEGAKAALNAGAKGILMGTSNVHFAHKYGLKAIGTIAHVRRLLYRPSSCAQEWIMGTAALNGYPGSNGLAMDKWEEVGFGRAAGPLTLQCYPDNSLSIALTDTFSSKPFFVCRMSTPTSLTRAGRLCVQSGACQALARSAAGLWRSEGLHARGQARL